MGPAFPAGLFFYDVLPTLCVNDIKFRKSYVRLLWLGNTTFVSMNSETLNSSQADTRSEIHNMVYRQHLALNDAGNSKLFSELSVESRGDLFSYLDQLGVSDVSALLVIPSAHHYFYNAEDLIGVKTILNLKQLNHVRDIKGFLQNIFFLLPESSRFVGSFVDNRVQNGFSDQFHNRVKSLSARTDAYENGIDSRIPFINRMYSLIDARTNSYLTRKSVTNLIQDSGLRLLSMTDLNGLTYFCSQKEIRGT